MFSTLADQAADRADAAAGHDGRPGALGDRDVLRLGNKIDVILRENYRSVLAAQRMKEALERMDSAALFAIGGQRRPGARAVRRVSRRSSRRT